MNLRIWSGIVVCLAASLACVSASAQAQTQDNSSASSHPATVKPKHPKPPASPNSSSSQSIQPYTAKPIQQYQAKPIQQYQAKPIQQYQAKPVQEYHSTPVAPGGQANGADTRATNSNSVRNVSLIRTFGLAVPGVAYTVDNYAAETRTIVTSTGTVTKSAVRINPNHTYDWNSAWDGRIIHGRWTEKSGGILLLHGQEGKDWLLRAMDRPSGKATVTLWDQNSIWYNGTPLN